MKKNRELWEDFRWNKRRPVGPADFNSLNDVAIFAGPLPDMYAPAARERVREIMDGGAPFALLDVRDEADYAAGHIYGAINIPVARIEFEAPGRIAKNVLVVVYGKEAVCTASAVGVDKLKTLAYKNVLRYAGGIKDWKGAGWRVEGKAQEGQKAA